MSQNPHVLSQRERIHVDIYQRDSTDSSFVAPYNEGVAFVERLPLALSYAASLEPGDHAILFYDNLVVAAEYFCAYIEEGINRQEATCFIGLSRERYEKLFDQVGVKVSPLENCGYLRHFPIQEFCIEGTRPSKNKAHRNIEDLINTSIESECRGMRFIVLNGSFLDDNSFQAVIEFERWLNTLSSYAMSTICCYDEKSLT